MKNLVILVKSVFVEVVAILCLVAALILQPWSELNFNPDAMPVWLNAIVPGLKGLMAPLAPLGDLASAALKANGATTNLGDYMYALVMFGIMTLIGIAYILVGREEAEEKTILPVKK